MAEGRFKLGPRSACPSCHVVSYFTTLNRAFRRTRASGPTGTNPEPAQTHRLSNEDDRPRNPRTKASAKLKFETTPRSRNKSIVNKLLKEKDPLNNDDQPSNLQHPHCGLQPLFHSLQPALASRADGLEPCVNRKRSGNEL